MTTTKLLNDLPPQKNVITLDEAESRTNFWREAIRPIYPNKGPDDLPRGFVIPFEDLAQLVDDYKDQGIDGVRVYLTFGSARPVGAEMSNQINGILIPVKLDGDIYKDIIEPVEQVPDGKAVSIQAYSIYDVTQPCPPCWDRSSPLF